MKHVQSLITALGLVFWASAGMTAPQVKLLDSPFRENALRERAFMESIDTRALTRMFRVTAGLETADHDAGVYQFLRGWEADEIELRGHTCGHWLSGMASLYEMTGDEKVKARANEVVETLARCQDALGNGYVSAFPENDIDKIIGGTRVWAPWYVLHKILAGLIDQYRCCGNLTALRVASRFGDWVYAKTSPLAAEQVAVMCRREFGGIGDALYQLYEITENQHHRDAAEVFRQADLYAKINGKHANTLIPKVIADWQSGRLVPERREESFAHVRAFWQEIMDHYCYAPGCVSSQEGFRGPNRQGDFLTGVTGETCCTYNLLKLSRLLFNETPSAALADYQERAVWNHILGQMEPIDGHLTYFLPLQTGTYKLQSRSNDSFWCCCGSAMESHTRYHRLICAENGAVLYINQFIPCEITWKGLTFRLETDFPRTESARLSVIAGAGEAELRIRRPFWTQASGVSDYVSHKKVWKVGDTVEIPLPCRFRRESVVHSQTGSRSTAVFYGPILMGAHLGIEGMRKDAVRSCNYFTHDYSIPEHLKSIPLEDPATWTRLAPPPPYDRGMDGASPEVPERFVEPTFRTPKGLIISPFWSLSGERMCVYFEDGVAQK